MDRKKKIKIIQAGLFLAGGILFLIMYLNTNKVTNIEIVSKKKQEEVKEQLDKTPPQTGDIFYNIEYSGLDLSGNRYILKASEAFNEPNNQNIINMKAVEAFFYFKDDTILKIFSENGVYNNKSLDMIFTNNVKADYEGSVLLSERAEYSNSNNFLKISEKVKLKDSRGVISADIFYFNIKNKTLEIASNENNNVNVSLNIK